MQAALQVLRAAASELACGSCDGVVRAPRVCLCGESACQSCWAKRVVCPCCNRDVTPRMLSRKYTLEKKASRVRTSMEDFEKNYKIKVTEADSTLKKLEIEREVFPKCIQARYTYYNKRKSSGTSKLTETSPVKWPGEVIHTNISDKIEKNIKSSFVESWLETCDKIGSKSKAVRQPFADIDVNIQKTSLRSSGNVTKNTLKRYIESNETSKTCSPKKSKIKQIEQENKNNTRDEDIKSGIGRNGPKHIEINKIESSLQNKEMLVNDVISIRSDKFITDEAITIDDSQATVVDKDQLALLEVIKEDAIRHKEQTTENENASITNDYNFPTFVSIDVEKKIEDLDHTIKMLEDDIRSTPDVPSIPIMLNDGMRLFLSQDILMSEVDSLRHYTQTSFDNGGKKSYSQNSEMLLTNLLERGNDVKLSQDIIEKYDKSSLQENNYSEDLFSTYSEPLIDINTKIFPDDLTVLKLPEKDTVSINSESTVYELEEESTGISEKVHEISGTHIVQVDVHTTSLSLENARQSHSFVSHCSNTPSNILRPSQHYNEANFDVIEPASRRSSSISNYSSDKENCDPNALKRRAQKKKSEQDKVTECRVPFTVLSEMEDEKVCVTCSCLRPVEVATVQVLCMRLGWTYSEHYHAAVTHLVVSTDCKNKSPRSVKYLCTLAASKWIVPVRWANECLSQEAHLEEESFEVVDSCGAPGPRLSRTATVKLFAGLTFCLLDTFTDLHPNILTEMLTVSGGRVVHVRPGAMSPEVEPIIALCQTTTVVNYADFVKEPLQLLVLDYKWAVECLARYTLLSPAPFLLHPDQEHRIHIILPDTQPFPEPIDPS